MVLVEVVAGSLILSPLNTKEECLEMFKEWMNLKDDILKNYLNYVEGEPSTEGRDLYLKLRNKL